MEAPASPKTHILALNPSAAIGLPACRTLVAAGVACVLIEEVGRLPAQVHEGVAAILVELDALAGQAAETLRIALRDHPRGPDVPILLLCRAEQPLPAWLAALPNNVALLEEPLRRRELVWLARSLLRTHRRQASAGTEYCPAIERELRSTQQRLERILNSSMIGIVVGDSQGGIGEANEYFLRLTGFTREDVQAGRARWTEITPPEHLAADRKAVDELRRTGRATPYEKEYVRRDGTRVPVLVSLAIFGDSTEQIVASVLDMTEHRQAEQALRDSEQAYRRLFENRLNGMAHGRVILDSLGRVTDFVFIEVNNTFEQMTGLSRDAIIGRRVTKVYPDLGAMCFNPVETCAQVAVTGEEGRYEFYQEQLERWYSLYAYSPRFGEFITIVSDITERKQAEQQLKQWSETLERRVAERTAELDYRAAQLHRLAKELLLAEDRERRRLAHVLHDHLQQLLVGARFSLSKLRSRLPDDDLRDAAHQVDELLNQSIGASRSLTAELSPPVLYDAGLAEAMAWLAGWMREKHSLEVDVEVVGSPNPQDNIRVLLFQAVRELLFNVVKHAGVSRAAVRLHELPDQVRIVVEDRGGGFDARQVLAAPSTPGGFGLFSIRQRLEWLGGQMHVDSVPGAGTRVELIAPLESPHGAPHDRVREAPLAQVFREAVRTPGRTPAPEALETPAHIRVLLADDHAVLRDGLTQLLETEPDIEVIGQAGDGAEAVDLALKLHPDVVLMDVTMPKMSGIEATRRIKEQLPATHVIGLSMHAEAGMAESMRQAGARGYLTKSAGPEELVSAIRAGQP